MLHAGQTQRKHYMHQENHLDPKVFVTSDLHFGHQNIIRFCSRPFKNREEMDLYLIYEWNHRVGEDDTVYVIGDFAMGPPATDGFIAGKIQNLTGKIKVVLGNHDQPVPKYGQSGLKKIIEDFYLQDKVEILPDLHSIEIGSKWFAICHYPMETWPHERRGGIHLHGHIHTQFNKRDALRARRTRKYDIGVDMYGGPVEITSDLRYLDNPGGWNV